MTEFNEELQIFPDTEMYSKSMSKLLFLKKFFLDGDFEKKEYELERKMATVYTGQTKRKCCKICKSNIEKSQLLFMKLNISYYLCDECGHVNGEYDDPFEYASELAKVSAGMAGSNDAIYSDNSTEERLRRVNVIYKPKIQYLIQILEKYGEDPAKLSYTEVGAGGGI